MKRASPRDGNAHAVLAIGVLFVAGCGNAGQSISPGTQTQAQAGELNVVFDSSSARVDLGSVATTTYKGVALVRLSDVWTAADFSVDATTLEFEFEADDGFTPASARPECVDLPGAHLVDGYIDSVSRNLTWDESLGLLGCYSVKGTNTMTGHAPVPDAGADGG